MKSSRLSVFSFNLFNSLKGSIPQIFFHNAQHNFNKNTMKYEKKPASAGGGESFYCIVQLDSKIK